MFKISTPTDNQTSTAKPLNSFAMPVKWLSLSLFQSFMFTFVTTLAEVKFITPGNKQAALSPQVKVFLFKQ
jgi:hypothetical protein